MSRLGHTQNNAAERESKLKVEPPKIFTGKGKELANFLFTLRAYLDVKGITSDTKRVQYAATRLDGDALVWWRTMDAIGTFAAEGSTFEDWCEALSTQFRTIDHELKLHKKLHELKQFKSVQAYTSLFCAFVLELNLHSTLSDATLKFQYMEGLKSNIK